MPLRHGSFLALGDVICLFRPLSRRYAYSGLYLLLLLVLEQPNHIYIYPAVPVTFYNDMRALMVRQLEWLLWVSVVLAMRFY